MTTAGLVTNNTGGQLASTAAPAGLTGLGIGTSDVSTSPFDLRLSSTSPVRFVDTESTQDVSHGLNFRLAADPGAAMASGSRLGGTLFGGATDGAGTVASGASIAGYATENWSGTQNGGKIVLATTHNGGTSRTDDVTVSQGNLSINNMGTAGVISNASGGQLISTTTLSPALGGTGVNNGVNTLTLAGNVSHSGAFTQAFAATGNTSVTLPTSGTLATLAGSETLTNKTLAAPVVASLVNGGTSAVNSATGTIPVTICALGSGDTNSSASGSGTLYNHSLTCALPANFLTPNRIISVTAGFTLTSGSAPPTLIHKLELGSTVISTHLSTTPAANGAGEQYLLTWTFQATSALGTAASLRTGMQTVGNGPASFISMNTAGTAPTAATNGPLTIQVGTLWGSAGTGTNTITLDQLLVVALN